MIYELYCEECNNDDSFIVEYYNTLMDSETMRGVMTDIEFQGMLSRGATETHVVRVDCTQCPNIVYE